MSTPVICFGQQPCGIFPAAIPLRQNRHGAAAAAAKSAARSSSSCTTATTIRGRRRRYWWRPAHRLRSAVEFRIREQTAAELFTALRQAGPAGVEGEDGAPASVLRGPAGGGPFQSHDGDNAADFCLEMYRTDGTARRGAGGAIERSGISPAGAARGTIFRRRGARGGDRAGALARRKAAAAQGRRFVHRAAGAARSARSKSVPTATPACAGCNRSSDVPTTSPGRGR